jgi:hypothetical protein
MKQSLFQTFAIPLLLLLLTLGGLIIGLMESGWWDWVAIAGLAIPLFVTTWAILSDRARRR